MTKYRQPKPPEIKDLKAHLIEQSLHWKRPHLKPLEQKVDKSGRIHKLEQGIVPALDVQGLVTHYWTWGDITHGDCVCNSATLWLSSDGTGRFYAYTKTDDSGDVWLFQGLALLDNNGVELYRIPQFDSPTMEWEDSWYTTDVHVLFPAYLFSSIVSITMYHHC